jgi:hypothetical protein
MRLAAAIVLALAMLTPTSAEASCIGATVGQLTTTVGTLPSGAIVVVSPLESDVAALPSHENELPLRVAELVAGKIAGAHAAARPATLEQARAMASRAPLLVYIHVQLVKSQLRVTVDVYPVIRNVWDRARLPPPPPTGHAYAAAPIDAEVRAFFPPLPLELSVVHKATHTEGDVLAVACGDLDGDGGAELMLVSRERISVGRIRAAKAGGVAHFEADKSVPWSTVAKRSPVPLRDPLAGAELDLGRALVGTSDRGGVVLDETLGLLREGSVPIPIGAGMCAPISSTHLAFEGPIANCDPHTTEPTRMPAFDAASAFELELPGGASSLATATREGGKIRVRVNGVERASFDSAGAQVALFDANLDGVPEIAFSSDATDDNITFATLSEPLRGVGSQASLSSRPDKRVINRIAAPAGVRALGACPPLDGGTAALVAVVGNEVWIVR